MCDGKLLTSKIIDNMKSDDTYIVKIRNLCSQQALFSSEEFSVLTLIFESLSGKPPAVLADRFRADNDQWLTLLDKFEYPYQFLKTVKIEDKRYYTLSPYALPLVEVARGVQLLDIMDKIYQNLRELYQDYLADPIEVEILIDGIDGYDPDEREDKEELLEALYYLSELSGVWSSKSNNFPYAGESIMCIAESVLRNDFMGDIIMKYFDIHYVSSILPSSHNSSMPLELDETKLTDADKADPEIEAVQPEIIGNFKWIQQKLPVLLKPRNLPIVIGALIVFIISIIYF